MKEKKKSTAKIVDKSSVNYTFTYTPANKSIDEKKDESDQNSKNAMKRSIKDIKNQNRHKVNSKNIKTLQGHSPVYE